jgi:hypothetical protein
MPAASDTIVAAKNIRGIIQAALNRWLARRVQDASSSESGKPRMI